MSNEQNPRCTNLVLDAGPLLSLSPLRGLAEKYLTTPQVLAELKDSRAREHFEKLGLLSGVKVEVRSPTPESLTQVIQWSKKTGDYSVLSHADICVIALTHTLHVEAERLAEQQKAQIGEARQVASTSAAPEETSSGEPTSPSTLEPMTGHSNSVYSVAFSPDGKHTVSGSEDKTIRLWDAQTGQPALESSSDSVDKAVDQVSRALEATSLFEPSEPTSETSQSEEDAESEDASKEDLEPLNVEPTPIKDSEETAAIGTIAPEPSKASASKKPPTPIYDDPSDEDDGEGEWITPENVALHKSRALDLLPDPSSGRKGKKKEEETIGAGCMTADFAMQNVLLQMGLNLVGLEGRRIEKVKTWVLRCHACYKLCKDSSKKFCPSCGNNTLLRASITLSSPTASKDAPTMQIHLKPNFQYKLRGTKYSIPAPKPGSAKTGAGTGLILREDQVEYMRAKKVADGKREREEARMMKGMLSKGVDRGVNAGVSSWMDPDWMPEILSVGAGGKGRTVRSSRMDGDLPQIGYGRKNPNEKRRRK